MGGDLYFKYCKKNMKVGSAKSMDELCQPMVKTVEKKMVWVPGDHEMTPELVCKTIDQIKAEFPDHAKVAEQIEQEKKKAEGAEEAERKELAEKAKGFSTGLGQDVAAILKRAGDTIAKELEASFAKRVKESFGGDIDERKKKMLG